MVVVLISSQKTSQPITTQTGKTIKKIIAKRRETWLKGEILHRAIMDISTKENSSDPP